MTQPMPNSVFPKVPLAPGAEGLLNPVKDFLAPVNQEESAATRLLETAKRTIEAKQNLIVALDYDKAELHKKLNEAESKFLVAQGVMRTHAKENREIQLKVQELTESVYNAEVKAQEAVEALKQREATGTWRTMEDVVSAHQKTNTVLWVGVVVFVVWSVFSVYNEMTNMEEMRLYHEGEVTRTSVEAEVRQDAAKGATAYDALVSLQEGVSELQKELQTERAEGSVKTKDVGKTP